MRDPESLPEDPEDWPSDPAELLGVPRTADEATVKRAYLKLVRRFKPDAFPLQFQRIRQAYEILLARAIARGSQESSPGVSYEWHSPAAVEAGRSDGESSPLERGVSDPVRQLRQLVKAGEFDQLGKLTEAEVLAGSSGLGTLLVRFLLRLARQEPDGTATDRLSGELLLVKILNRSPELGLSLLAEQLRADPTLARSNLFENCLNQLAGPQHKLQLLQLKWGCLTTEDWSEVLDEGEAQQSWALDFPQQWAALGCEVLKFACWHRQFERADTWVERFAQDLQSVAFRLQEQSLLLLDELQELQAELIGRQSSLRGFNWRLIPHSYSRHLWLNARDLHPLWERAHTGPLQLLKQLDQVASDFPKSVAVLRGLIRRLYLAVVDPDSVRESDQAAAVCKFLNQQGNASYPALRPAILRFCVDHGMQPSRFGYLANSRLPPGFQGDWAGLLQRDLGLDCVSQLLQLPLARPESRDE